MVPHPDRVYTWTLSEAPHLDLCTVVECMCTSVGMQLVSTFHTLLVCVCGGGGGEG